MTENVLITGTSTGVGFESAILFAKNNYKVYATMRNLKKSEKLKQKIQEENLNIEKFPAEKALYLSIVKPSGIHRKEKNILGLYNPNNLNFENVWSFISQSLKKRYFVKDLIVELEKEPFGLDRTKALFVISLYIIVNKDTLNIFRDNTYVFELSTDMLINIWKATDKFELNLIKLSKNEKELFKAYVQITTDLTDYEYSKEKVTSIIKILYDKFNHMPKYAHQTQKLSKEAILLRSALISMREPTKTFFNDFPKALGFNDIENIDNEEFLSKFKKSFNEIALSYKEVLVDLDKNISSIFLFKTDSFPYEDSLINMSNKLSKINTLDNDSKAIIRCFTYSNSLIEFVDGLCMILIRKKIEQCYDNDITTFIEKLTQLAHKLLSKLELVDIVSEDQDIRKISLTSLDKNLNKIISINKNEIDTIDKKVVEMKELIPTEYTNDQKLYLISQLLNEEFHNE